MSWSEKNGKGKKTTMKSKMTISADVSQPNQVYEEHDTPAHHEALYEKDSIDETQLERIKEAFLIFDHDKDGQITKEEMVRAMQSLGHETSEEEVTHMLKKADFNNNGTIEFDEFVGLMMRAFPSRKDFHHPSRLEDDLHAMFNIFDLNKDGRITPKELNHVMRTLGENLRKHELEAMMRTADTNGDGVIDFQEFQNLFSIYHQRVNGSR